MENHLSSVESLIERFKNYAETRIDLLKLKAIDKSSSFLSLLISMLSIILLGFIFIIVVSIAIALLIGDLLGKSYYGFFIVAGFYALLVVIIILLRNKVLKAPIADMMIKKLME